MDHYARKRTILGIFRERSHSPQREFDDEAILKATAKRLSSALGIKIPLIYPEEFLEAGLDVKPDLIFYMCEEEPCLLRLRELQESMGCILVNSVEGVENTFRKQMLRLLSREEFFPESSVVSTREPEIEDVPDKVWVKRGDFHAIEKEDVLFASNMNELKMALEAFSIRGIKDVIFQEHVPGDIIKFYSVTNFQKGKEYWFKWFYHKDQDLKGYVFSQDVLKGMCQRAGMLLGLEIFGGDAIVRSDGTVFVIDVNAWPSFALFRDIASRAIASLIGERLLECGYDVQPGMCGKETGAQRPAP